MPSRRQLLSVFGTLGGLAASAGLYRSRAKTPTPEEAAMNLFPIDFQWPVQEPFIFCAHHHDFYPKGTKAFGPPKNEHAGRDMGQDFIIRDGYRMYHGMEVPGFPVHPHRGFETITIVRKGYVDHSDSMGAAGRYGEGDVQWMTAGNGVQHSEMFPLLREDQSNTLELFQLWLNLPKRNKRVQPHFKMFWSEQVPHVAIDKDKAKVTVIAGQFDGTKALAPPPDSWAADPSNGVTILILSFEADGRLKIPAAAADLNRTLYFFTGERLLVNGREVVGKNGIQLAANIDVELRSPGGAGEVLLMQAKPIGEPVFQHGPFVMNTRNEIVEAIQDYQRTQFGGWPWPQHEMVHGPGVERFAKYPDGKVEKPG